MFQVCRGSVFSVEISSQPFKGSWEDDVPRPQAGYVISQEARGDIQCYDKLKLEHLSIKPLKGPKKFASWKQLNEWCPCTLLLAAPLQFQQNFWQDKQHKFFAAGDFCQLYMSQTFDIAKVYHEYVGLKEAMSFPLEI